MLTILAAGVAAYHNSLSGAFIFDDYSCIPENPHIRTLWPPWAAMSSRPEIAVAGRPLVSLTLAINYAVGGLDVLGYHLVNLALHLLVALTLFGVIRRTLLSPRLRPRYGRAAAWLALVIVLLWMVHPLVTESVNYIVQRTELLMGLFLLLTLYSVIRGSASKKPSRGWYAAAVGACLLGMGSKEVMVVAPLLALLYDGIFLSRSWRETWRRRRGLYAGFFLTWLALAALLVQQPRTLTAGFQLHITPWEYALTQGGVLVHYLRLAFWPHPLVVDYGDWPVARTLAEVWPAALLVAALVSVTVWAGCRRSPLGFLGAWGLLILAPTSSLLPIVTEIAAERRMYLPLAAVVTLVVIIGWDLLRALVARASRRRALAVGLAALSIVTLGGLTIRRNEEYRTEAGMLRDVIAKRPRNVRAHNNLGLVLAGEGRLKEATAHFREAVRLEPAYADAHSNLGVVLIAQDHLEDAKVSFVEALRLKPDLAQAHNNLGVVLMRQRTFGEAIRHYTEALRLQPAYADAHSNLGVALAEQGRWMDARTHLRQALRLDPANARAHSNLGMVLARQGRLEEAILHYAEALRLNPNLPETHNSLGTALAKQGKWREAAAHYLEALRLKPDYETAYTNWRTALNRQDPPN